MSEESPRWCWPMKPLGRSAGIGGVQPGDMIFDRTPNRGQNIRLPLANAIYRPGTLPAPGNAVRVLCRELGVTVDHLIGFEWHEFYVPDDADLTLSQDLFPDADPGNPPWLKVEAELVTVGIPSVELRKETALTLLNRLKASRKEPERTPFGDALPKGVSLLDVALLFTDGDEASAKETRKRWHNSRKPELPDSIGEDSEDSRAGLYSLSAIFDFIKIVEARSELEIAGFRQRIQHRVRPIRLPTIV